MKMANAHGGKHLCSNCNSRFYDLGRQPAVCPKCEFVVAIRAKPATPYTDSKAARRQSSLRRLAAKRNFNAVPRE